MGCIYAHILRAKESEHYGWWYIGQAVDIDQRWHNQRIEAYKGSRFIYNEFKKYGWDAFDHIILEDNIPEDKLNEREIYWIKKYHTFIGDPEYKGGFNLTSGGEGSRGPKLTRRGIVPDNIPSLTEMKRKPIKCWNSGIWRGVKYTEEQTWDSIDECAEYFKVNQSVIGSRVNQIWNLISGPIFTYADEECAIDQKKNIEKLKEKRHQAGFKLAQHRKNAFEVDYDIYCVETGETFKLVKDCLEKFNMARSTLNGHLLYPDRHKTAKGYHFKRIPKTNTDS